MLKGIREYLLKPRGTTGKIIQQQEDTTIQIEGLEKTLSDVDFDRMRKNIKRLNNSE